MQRVFFLVYWMELFKCQPKNHYDMCSQAKKLDIKFREKKLNFIPYMKQHIV